MTIRFNESQDFPINNASESHNTISIIPDLLICSLPCSEKLYNDILNYLQSNIITKIEILNNLQTIIYTTSTLVNFQLMTKQINNDFTNIQINFGA